MTKKEYLVKEYDSFMEARLSKVMDFYKNPSIARIEPFEIADGLWYVGDKKVCIHLIDTGDGLILVDSGYLGATHILVDSIWRAGFDPSNIRMIIHTHGHSDHYGASDEFARMYGCKLAISRIDAEHVKKLAEDGRIGGRLYPLAKAPIFDTLIDDGDVIEMGRVKIKCILSPGHTEGVLSLFFDVTYLGKTYRAGLFGGAGTNAITLKYIYKNNSPRDCDRTMLKTVMMLRDIPVDIHLGNHPANNRTLEKREMQIKDGGNPFIDPESFGNYMDTLADKIRTIIDENEKLDRELDAICDN